MAELGDAMIERMRAVCGGLDGLTDETLAAMGQAALDFAEAYTGRKLAYDDYEETLTCACDTVLLSAYPVDRIESVTVDGEEINPQTCALDAKNGVLTLPRRGSLCTVAYSGGYDDEDMPGPIVAACGMLALSLSAAGENGGQQMTFQALDGYQVTYASKSAAGDELAMLSPVAAVMLKPYCARQGMRAIK